MMNKKQFYAVNLGGVVYTKVVILSFILSTLYLEGDFW